jgi:predicted Fe-S protein YdhL (DUF1289 family)
MTNVKSPCNNICKLDDYKICIGCFRTIEEISNWSKYNHTEKILIFNELEKRQWQKQENEQ